jgi:tetraacyldisaccharide 4'-kinase
MRGIGTARQRYGADTVVLDDAYQQWGVRKDLEILTVDATNPFGNGYLIPRGLLREPLTAVRRAQIIVITKTNLAGSVESLIGILRRLNPAAEIYSAVHQPVALVDVFSATRTYPVQSLRDKEAAVCSAIADPASFERLLRMLGVKLSLAFRFPDHHQYRGEDVEKIVAGMKHCQVDTLVTTEKDAVRLRSLACSSIPVRVLALRVKMRIVNDEAAFVRRLYRLYAG